MRPATAERPLSLLLIEDDADLAALTRAYLVHVGHEVVVAGTGEEGLALASDDFDAAIVDGNLPDTDGLAIARELRRRGLRLRLVLCTGNKLFTAELATEAGFDAHLTKPAAMTTLLGVVHGATGVWPTVE